MGGVAQFDRARKFLLSSVPNLKANCRGECFSYFTREGRKAPAETDSSRHLKRMNVYEY